jgi:hypothetical protein
VPEADVSLAVRGSSAVSMAADDDVAARLRNALQTLERIGSRSRTLA